MSATAQRLPFEVATTANYFFWRFFSSSTISTKLFERRKACGLGLSRCCAAPASLLLRNQFDKLFRFRGPNGFGGGFIGGMNLPSDRSDRSNGMPAHHISSNIAGLRGSLLITGQAFFDGVHRRLSAGFGD